MGRDGGGAGGGAGGAAGGGAATSPAKLWSSQDESAGGGAGAGAGGDLGTAGSGTSPAGTAVAMGTSGTATARVISVSLRALRFRLRTKIPGQIFWARRAWKTKETSEKTESTMASAEKPA